MKSEGSSISLCSASEQGSEPASATRQLKIANCLPRSGKPEGCKEPKDLPKTRVQMPDLFEVSGSRTHSRYFFFAAESSVKDVWHLRVEQRMQTHERNPHSRGACASLPKLRSAR